MGSWSILKDKDLYDRFYKAVFHLKCTILHARVLEVPKNCINDFLRLPDNFLQLYLE